MSPSAIFRRPIVGLMGSGRWVTPEAAQVGSLAASRGYHLLTGGGAGQMEAACQAFVEHPQRLGLTIGVLPAESMACANPPQGYPNPFIEVPVQTHLWQRGSEGATAGSRNSVNVLSSGALIFVYGEAGTLSEAHLAQRYGRPRALFLLAETRERFDCSELLKAFQDNTYSGLEDLDGWLKKTLPEGHRSHPQNADDLTHRSISRQEGSSGLPVSPTTTSNSDIPNHQDPLL